MKKKLTVYSGIAAIILVAAMVCVIIGTHTPSSDTYEPNRVPVFVASDAASQLTNRTEELKAKLSCGENDILTINESGQLRYFKNVSISEEKQPIMLSGQEAVARAEQILSDLKLLPQEDYRACVRSIGTSEYTVFFYRVSGGADVISDQEDGIKLSFDNDGVTDLWYFWREMRTETLDSAAQSPITAEAARKIYYDLWDERHGTCCEPCVEPTVSHAYLQLGDTTRPCWVISEDGAYLNAWYVDMFTGQVLA